MMSQGMAPVRGCKVEVIATGEKPFMFVVKHEARSPLYLAADDEKMMKCKTNLFVYFCLYHSSF